MWKKLTNACRVNTLGIVVGVASLLIVVVLLNYFTQFPHVRSSDQAVWGQFGDYFGGVLNPLLSFAALVGLLVTLRSQQKEGGKNEDRYKQQTFDSRMFQLLSLSHEAVSVVKYVRTEGFPPRREEYEGHQGVAYALNRLQEEYLYTAERKSDRLYVRLNEQYEKWKSVYWSGVASYVESMLFILKYVLENTVKNKSGSSFALRAVFAQMSSDEKLLVFYVMIFTPDQSLLLFNELIREFLKGASKDDFLPFRQELLMAAAHKRLSQNL